jgi:mRNA interferase MazF
MQKDFEDWSKKKIMIEKRTSTASFFCKEIWWCNLGINIGTETDGKDFYYERPVLIIRFWNKKMVWVVPLTSKSYFDKYHYPLIILGKEDFSFIKLTQIRTISTKRLVRKLGNISQKDFENIISKITKFLNTKPLK